MTEVQFAPDQRLKMAEMEYRHKCEMADMQSKCCHARIDGNERVLTQIEANNKQQACCCNSLADVAYCCCKK